MKARKGAGTGRYITHPVPAMGAKSTNKQADKGMRKKGWRMN